MATKEKVKIVSLVSDSPVYVYDTKDEEENNVYESSINKLLDDGWSVKGVQAIGNVHCVFFLIKEV